MLACKKTNKESHYYCCKHIFIILLIKMKIPANTFLPIMNLDLLILRFKSPIFKQHFAVKIRISKLVFHLRKLVFIL